MDFGLTPEQEKLRQRVSDFLDRELTDEIRKQHPMGTGLGPEGRAFARKLGAEGLMGIGWPKEYGGSGGTFADEYVLVTEFARHGARVPMECARLMGGPAILRFGSEAMKQEFLPRIARGEIEFGLGYTEPQAGSDLMMMEMRAVQDGDDYIINGQKMFNTACHYADYHFLAVKTDFTAPRHSSMSMFVVDQRAPGITIRPLWSLGGERTNEIFYDNVRVPKSRLIGEKNMGFLYLLTALNHERLLLFPIEWYKPVLQRLIKYTKETRRNGRLLADDPVVRQKLADIAIELEVIYCIQCQAFSMISNGGEPDFETGLAKLMGSELTVRLGYCAMDIMGFPGRLGEGSKEAPLNGEMDWFCKESILATVGGGSSEIQRNLLAMRGLGLPR